MIACLFVTQCMNHQRRTCSITSPMLVLSRLLHRLLSWCCDISSLLRFHFWKHVCFNSDDSKFPSDSTEEIGRFAKISENVGCDMNFSILNTTTNEVISRSNVRPTGKPAPPNLRIDPLTTPEARGRQISSPSF